MSSEQNVSVGGSEEVRALEYGDVGMTSESSDSERTEEGVGRSEMVGVEGDRVPITVVEVEDRNERCYDVDADIVSEVKQYEFELGTRDSLGYLVESYEISFQVLIRPARVEERACSAPRDHWMPMYAHYLAVGLSLNEDEEEEVGKLVRGGNLVNIMYFTSADCIEAAEFYGLSALSEAEMDKFLNATGGVAIPKKPRKKSKTSTKEANEVEAGKELVLSTSAGVEEVRPKPKLKRKGSEELGALQRKKKVVEQEVKGSKVRAPGKGKGLVSQLSFQSSLFDTKNSTGARRFINATFPEVDKRQAKEEVLRYCGATVVKHGLEERDSLSTKLVFEEKKRKIFEIECEAQEKEIKAMKEVVVELKKNVQLLVHNGMEEHISNFVNSSSFDNIVNLYRLPTTILAFTDCRKKVKVEYPEVDIMKITFGEQEEGVEENDESMSADFRPQIKLRWDRDAEGRTIFPLNFDFEFVAVEEEEAKVEGAEVGAEVEGVKVDESQPPLQVEVYPVPSNDE
ncbi:hypothetical protein SLEP1_g55019 [Rubroshorea leprosula]|uniref:Uncharacterized protein n=1 Tax=Rubroshorea leprosula TaxID=152421 RepID=A0AAV5MFA1_9ROSI|nr:hypothetical protein SLEP1_g55019 [Rubroshorea leprosula]